MKSKIEKTLRKGKYSYLKIDSLNLTDDDLYFRDINETSLGFKTGAVEKTISFFLTTFKLTNEEQFRKKFVESISGDGDELAKNNALHSSSLCALLCFYNVKTNHLVLNDIVYDDVYFEFKNKVVKNPSNMDVVLTGKDKNGDESILFIECKFSEFLGTKSSKLGETYKKEPFKHIFDGFQYEKRKVFQYGLKQLVTHYIGIKNFMTEDPIEYKKCMKKYYRSSEVDRINLYRSFKNVSFLEVVFEFEKEPDFQQYLDETKLVFETLEQERKTDNLNLNLLGTVTYQHLFRDYKNGINSRVLDPVVMEFYNLK